jgi:hypothetical protein
MNNPTALGDLHEMRDILKSKRNATQRAIDSFHKMIARYGNNDAATRLVNLWTKEIEALDASRVVLTESINKATPLKLRIVATDR